MLNTRLMARCVLTRTIPSESRLFMGGPVGILSLLYIHSLDYPKIKTDRFCLCVAFERY